MYERKFCQLIMKIASTHAFFEQLFTSVLQTLPTLFHASPTLQHTLDFLVDLIYSLNQSVACFQVLRDTGEMCTKVGFLTMRHRAVDESEPVVELLRGLYGVLGVQRAAGVQALGRARAWDYGRVRTRRCDQSIPE